MFEDVVKKYEKNSIVIAIIMTILGVFLFVKPVTSITVIVSLFGIITVLDGLLHVISYFRTEESLRLMSFELVEGITEVIVGILIITGGKTLSTFFPIMIGIWIIIKSIIKFQIGMNLKSVPDSNYLLTIISSIITLIFGFIVILNPFSSIIAVTRIVGIYIVVYEIMNIIESVHMLKVLK
ncbi:MAG: hypothetical protein HFJ46_02250 [Clostridia bacterium]|jgi:uncharacterized membrane protein HdeD (DUF308 family)|nr:hypothetical protein [Clostridia bacterium]